MLVRSPCHASRPIGLEGHGPLPPVVPGPRLRRPLPGIALLAWAVAVAGSLVGCAGGQADACRIGADCASGMCRGDGTCVPLPDAAGGDGATNRSDASTDGQPSRDARPDAERSRDGDPGDGGISRRDGGLPGCSPNHDGVISRAEMPLMAGLRSTFRVARDVMVDTSGEVLSDERRRWDFTESLPGDHAVLVEAQTIDGTWYADEFPNASYATRLNDEDALLGVFRITGEELLLLGIVSPEDGFLRTRLTYDPPVTVLDFPLEPGKTWSTDSSVSGTAQGSIVAFSEEYRYEIDARGEIVTPFGTFEGQRIASVLERTSSGIWPLGSVRSFLFVTECFGTVASATSQNNESEKEFTEAAEVRRLAP